MGAKKESLHDLFSNRSDFTEAIHTYRQQQQTLAGIPLNRLEEDLIQIIRRKYPNIEVNEEFLTRQPFSSLCFSSNHHDQTATSNASAGVNRLLRTFLLSFVAFVHLEIVPR